VLVVELTGQAFNPQLTIKGIIALVNALAIFAVLIFLIAARKTAESRLQTQREWFRGMLSSIGDAVIATDLNGLITYINPSAASLTGWRSSDANNKPLSEVLDLDNESDVRGEYLILVSRGGARRPIEQSSSPIYNVNGQIEGTVVVFRDVTERRRLESQMIQGRRWKP